MSNVIKVDFKGEDEKNGYSTLDDSLVGVVNRSLNMEMFEIGDGYRILSESSDSLNRKEMAEFLWMAAYMLDSEQRWAKDEYVGLNYKDGE